MATRSLADEVASLNAIVTSALSLFSNLQDVLEQINPPPSSRPPTSSTSAPRVSRQTSPPAVDAVPLAKDCAELIKAHSAKIVLLLTHEPYSPKAAVSVITQLMQSPVAVLVTAAQGCVAEDYTLHFRTDFVVYCRLVLTRLIELFSWIPLDGCLAPASNSPNLIVGKLWSACDNIIDMAKVGVKGYIAAKIDNWRDTLKDIRVELKGWSMEEPDGAQDNEEDKDEEDDDGVNSSDEAQDLVDQLMGGPDPIPADDPHEIRPRLNVAIKRLGLIYLFYQAVVKRRIKTAPTLPPPSRGAAIDVCKRLEDALVVLEKLPDHFEAIAHALYDQDTELADTTMDICMTETSIAVQLLKSDWQGDRDDEFSKWLHKFQTQFQECGLSDGS
ncbi:hypothetical protein JDV02_008672 [Purpureocillium takamizusanense]|uniref:Uncharacterized protein n=1 Tax=Purpureocillium takamizusanense TaxID=2060973 RepID=A0A9Q8VEP1_9HYPO|nr:uncharacterized protein JDV02_008672 [Purpureocillium takamizusanense]UNI22818.1 hypothetical protein JDV02_008672 [Purpureocillium takamizusanense]